MCCYILSEHFTGIFLFLCMIRYEPSHSGISVFATPLNSSEEIRNIFKSLPDVTESALKAASGSGNFAEGGVINLNSTHSMSATSITKVAKTSTTPKIAPHDKSLPKKENDSRVSTNSSENGSHDSFAIFPNKTSIASTKLTETGSNLFLGVPEVIHINGISSIKPRKGVHYNKIVPRKGVDTENESSHGLTETCFQLTESECYNVTGIHGVECNCCKNGNELGKVVKQQVLVNCTNCKPINALTSEKEVCKNICCQAVVHDIYSGSTSQDISNNYLHYETVTSGQKKEEKVGNVSENIQPPGNLTKKTIIETKGNDGFVSWKKNSTLKPSMTKVPYDVEVVTELLSKNQQKVFVPIVVSIFLLPLIGILLYFLWRRTKEYWDKRYYKRMDFLIDGIYND